MGRRITKENDVKHQKIALLFPGQGAQYPGMGKEFAEQYPMIKHTFEEADDLLKRNLSAIVWNGSAEELTETRNSQTAIYVLSTAYHRLLHSLCPSLTPFVCAGLSLGEYSALTAAGILPFTQGLQLVEKRGQFMNDACLESKGTMAVVMGMEAPEVEELVDRVNMPHDLWVANLNCPGQVVISGTLKGIEAGSAKAKEAGAKRVLPLQVFGAFHSGLMKSAADRLAPYIEQTPLKDSSKKLVMNVPGDFVADHAQMKKFMKDQVIKPVRWEQGIRAMGKEGIDLFIELGCGKTLSGMNKRIGVTAPTRSLENINELEPLLKELT